MAVVNRWASVCVWIGLCSVLLVTNVLAGAVVDASKKIPSRPSLLKPEDVAVIFNVNDAQSEEIARYYLQARQVPAENLIGVELPRHGKDALSAAEFESLKTQLDAKLTNQQVLLNVTA